MDSVGLSLHAFDSVNYCWKTYCITCQNSHECTNGMIWTSYFSVLILCIDKLIRKTRVFRLLRYWIFHDWYQIELDYNQNLLVKNISSVFYVNTSPTDGNYVDRSETMYAIRLISSMLCLHWWQMSASIRECRLKCLTSLMFARYFNVYLITVCTYTKDN
jgi:hypothetical protein